MGELASPDNGSTQEWMRTRRSQYKRYPVWPDAFPGMARHTSRIRQQAERRTKLVGGILSYSGVRKIPEGVSDYNLREFVEGRPTGLGGSGGRLPVSGDTTTPSIRRLRLEQVLEILFENAFKYRRDRPKAVVEPNCERYERICRRSKSDNGPGAERRFMSECSTCFRRCSLAIEWSPPAWAADCQDVG